MHTNYTHPPKKMECRRKHRTSGDRVSVYAPGRHQESLQHDGTRASQPAKPSSNSDDTGQTRICRKAVCTAMQCLRPLPHSGGSSHKVLNAYLLPCTKYQNTKILHRTLKGFHLNVHCIFLITETMIKYGKINNEMLFI